MRHSKGTCPLALMNHYARINSCIIAGTIDFGNLEETFSEVVL
jgi:hypothetical protein